MKEYNAKYTGMIIAEWEYDGRQFEARQHEDYFGYICEYNNGYLCVVGDTGYDYFLDDNWKPLAQRLGVHKTSKKGVSIRVYNGHDTFCDDCEGEDKKIAQWLVSGDGPTGYLYLCNEHEDEYVTDLFGG
jgi:hypothetical protein